MTKLLRMDWKWLVATVVVLDAVTVAMGFGIPFFTILLGFPLGWFIARRGLAESGDESDDQQVLPGIFLWSVAASLPTFVFMLLIWGRSFALLGAPDEALANLGIPPILYEPRESIIAWLVLMLVVSPTMQLLTTVFAGFLTLMVSGWPKRD